MKKTTLLLVCVFAVVLANAQSKEQIVANEAAFTRLYGYVKYFYPGDEAAAINWDNFAIYGAKKVANCKTKEELKQTLYALFNTIAPTLRLVDSSDNVAFNKQSVTPPSLSSYKTIAWQHVGVHTRSLNYVGEPFKSARTNRPIYFYEYSDKFGVASKWIDISAYRNRKFIVSGRAKMVSGSGYGQFFVNIDLADRKLGFFNNMQDNPITTKYWRNFEIYGEVDSNALHFGFGPLLTGNGELWVDSLKIVVEDGNGWKNIYVNDFNQEKTGITYSGILMGLPLKKPDTDYFFSIIEDADKPADKWLSIKSKATSKLKKENHTVFFKDYPKVGEYITKDIGSGLKIVMPIALYGNAENTYPMADAGKFEDLKNNLNAVSTRMITADSLTTRFADLAITWNVFQHFFPYLDIAKTNWQGDLREALADAYDDKDGSDFLKTLKKFTAKLKDEHTGVYWIKDQNAYYPPITWEWIENKLVITRVLDRSLPLTTGDVITAIDSQTPQAYFNDIKQYIAAGTAGGLTEQAQSESLKGPRETALKISYLNHDNIPGQASLVRKLTHHDHLSALSERDSVKQIDDNIMYLNITKVNIKTIDKLLPRLQKSKAIICDMRNYMTDNWTTNHFIEYLITKKDTATHWGQTAHIIYPDQERISGYFTEGFDLVPAKPHLNAKIIFLIDASAYSWAESYMSIIAHYKLATIVGQPTAGTNGDVNDFSLPGGYKITFSGLKITQLDLTQHQGVGTKPDVYVNKTIEGIRNGKDEFLDKAIEIARATP